MGLFATRLTPTLRRRHHYQCDFSQLPRVAHFAAETLTLPEGHDAAGSRNDEILLRSMPEPRALQKIIKEKLTDPFVLNEKNIALRKLARASFSER